ncbi:hypothetical protein BH10BAC2_BH10BAC2_15910 [soil metagenome]
MKKNLPVIIYKRNFLFFLLLNLYHLFKQTRYYSLVSNCLRAVVLPFKICFSKIKLPAGFVHRRILPALIMLLCAANANAQPAVSSQPGNFISTCPPVTNSIHTNSLAFALTKGTCGNSGTFTFVWQYFNGVSWVNVTNNTPAGFSTYTVNTTNSGSGSNVAGSSTLTIQLASNVVGGTYQFRSICTYSQCAGSPVTSNAITFTVYSKPSPTLTGSVSSSCVNNNVTYTTESGQSGYSWTFPGVAGTDYTIISGGNTTSNTAVVKWLTTGSKSVTVNYSNSNGCTASSATSTTTTVNAAPTPTFTVQPSGTICSNTDVTYTTQPGQSSYGWVVPGTLGTDYTITAGGIGSGSNTVTLTWLTPGNKTVTINYANASGCSAATATSSNTISVNTRPVPAFTSPPGANTCSGTDVTYTTGSGGSSYVWSVPGVLNTDYTITSGSLGSGSNTVTLQWLTAGSKTVTVNYMLAGCTGLSAASSTTNVNLRPTVTFTNSAPANICAGIDVTYTTQAGQSNYTWTVEGTAGTDYIITAGSIGTSSNTVTLQWLTSGASRTVTVNYTNGSSCSALTAVSSTTFVNAKPVPTFVTSPDATTCVNTDVTYSTQPGQSSYVWNVPGAAGVDYIISAGGTSSTNNSVTLQWLTSGGKTVTVNYTNSNGCTSLSAASSNTTVNIPATPAITAGGATAFCSGGSVTLTSSSATSYQWYKDGSIIAGATLISYSATASGSYTVRTFNASGCDATSLGTTVTVNPLPAINTAAQASSLCASSSSQISTLDYSDVDNAPITYSITWNAAAIAAGFTLVTDAALPASPIDITVPANAPNGNYIGTITVTNSNGCTSLPKTFSVRITARPKISDFNISAADGCEATGATITINSTTLINGTYTVIYDLNGANTSTGNTATMVFNGSTGTFIASAATNLGSTDITITEIALVGCSSFPSSGNTATFTINAIPAVAAIGGPDNVCINSTITLTDATSGGTWSSSDASIASINSSGVVTGLSVGTVDIIYTTAANANNCTNSTTKTITVNPLPALTAITGTTSLCMGTTTNLNNTTPGGTWSSSNTTIANVDNTGLVTASSTTSGTSIITYTLPADANGCANSTAVTITVDPAATANAGSGVPVCQSASPSAITLSGATIGGGATTGAWSIVSGGGALSSTAQTANPGNVTYTPASNYAGNVTLLLTTNTPGSCAAVTSTRTITVSQLPTVSAGGPNTVCESATPSAITLSGAVLGGGATTGAWSITLGSGTLSSSAQMASPETVTFTPAANFSGPITLTLTTNASGACSAATGTRTITVTAKPTVTPGGPDILCKGASALTLSGAGFAGSATSAAWSVTSSGGGTLSTTAQTASPSTATYTPVSSFTGTITLTLTSNATGGCSAATGTRTININDAATAVAGSAITTCSNSGAVNITAASTASNYSNITWTSGGTGTFTNANSLTTATYTPSAADITAGSVNLTLTATGNAPCGNATSTKTLTIKQAPAANAGTSVITCANGAQTVSGSSAVNITTGSSASNYSNLLWTSSGTGTWTNQTSLTTATYTPSAADKAAGSVTLTLTATGNSPCVSATSTKTLTITPEINESSVVWVQQPTCLGNGSEFVITGTITGGNGTYGYQWMSKSNCGSAGPSVPVPGATSPIYIPTDGNCYWLQISSGGCTVPETLISTTHRERQSPDTAALALVKATAGSDTICIGSSTTLTASSGVSYNYTWSPATGLSSTTGANVQASPLVTTTYTVTGTFIQNASCTKTTTITITVNPLATLSNVQVSPVCDGVNTTTVTLTGLLANSTSGITYTIGSGAPQTVNGIISNGAGTATFTIPVSLANNGQTLTITSIGSSISGGPSCVKSFSGTAAIVIDARPTAVLSGSQVKCSGGSASLTINVTGPGTISGTLSDGTTFSGTSPVITVNVNPIVTTTYTVNNLANATCTSIAADISGSATVICPTGAPGLWTGLVDNDWFNCRNWGDAKVPTITVDVTIPGTATNTCRIDAATSPYAALFSNVAICKNITVDNNTLSFAGTADSLLVAGNVTIQNNAVVDMTTGGKIETQGNWSDQVNTAGKGFINGIGLANFSGSSTQTISALKGTELFYNLQIKKTTTAGLVNLNTNVTVDRNLTLTQGIITTGNNLFTWNNSGGTLTAPEPAYTNASLNYTKSFIATCDAAGNPITVADATTPFGGNMGFRIKNIGNANTYFPIGASYLPADNTYPVPAPNRMMINNQSGTSQDYTAVVNYGDIGYTNGTGNAWKVNRIWYVKAEPVITGKATMRLFFTKRDWIGWGSDENEVEAGFNYAQTALVQKDYSPDRGSFINLSSGGDIQDFTQSVSYPYNTEIYGIYTINVSNSLTNGIAQFNRFSVVNPGDIILPVSLSNLKAYQKENKIQVDWEAHNELNMRQYEIEKSLDGNSFVKIGITPALNNGLPVNRYTIPDANPLQGNNFYRIKAIDKDGRVIYSTVVKVNISNVKSSIVVMPNPVIDNTINIKLNNVPSGRYNLILYNVLGQPVLQRTIEHAGGSSSQVFTLPSAAPNGVYVLRLLNKSGSFETRLVVQ